MSAFDPTSVRRAIAGFTPPRAGRYESLMSAKEVIAELRERRASYQSIADVLTQHCLPTSKTSVARFCHEVLGERLRWRGRTPKKRPATATEAAEATTTTAVKPPVEAAKPLSPTPAAEPRAAESSPRTRGPRIAQIRLQKPTPS